MTTLQPTGRDFVTRALTLDRRFIYLIVVSVTAFAVVAGFDLPVRPTKNVRGMYAEVERLAKSGGTMLVSMDYDPGSAPELTPMATALLRHVFQSKVKLVVMTLSQNGQGIAEAVVKQTAAEANAKYGEDYAVLGYKPGFGTVILNMGQDFRDAYNSDSQGNRTAELPVTRNIVRLGDFDYVVSITSTAAWEAWMVYGHERYRFTYGVGVTGVMAPDVFPFLDTKQVVGMLGGLAGAAEYEALIGKPGAATKGMSPQSAGHVLIAAFIVFANILYFYDIARRRRRPA